MATSLNIIHMNKKQVEMGLHKKYNPDCYDFRWDAKGGVEIAPLLWWDEASYLKYQSMS